MRDDKLQPAQLHAARALLGWSQSDLARQAGLARATVQRVERGRVTYRRSMFAMQSALERAGVAFIPDNHAGGHGVRLKKPEPRESPHEVL